MRRSLWTTWMATFVASLLLLTGPAWGDCLDAILDAEDVHAECADDPAAWARFEARYRHLIEASDLGGLADSVTAHFLSPNATDDDHFRTAKAGFKTRLQATSAVLRHDSLEDRREALLLSDVGQFQLDLSMLPARIFPGTDEEILLFSEDEEPPLDPSERAHLALLALSLQRVFQDELAGARARTLTAIRQARSRWTGYMDEVTTRQLPWEVGVNALLGPTGDIEHPPSWQLALLHPSVGVEIGPEGLEGARLDELTGRLAVGVEILGFQRYAFRAERVDMTWGLSAYVSRIEDTGDLGLGPLLRMGGVGDVAVVFRNFDLDQWGVVLDLDLVGEIGTILGATKGLIASEKLRLLDSLEASLASE
jgi:hypothetical protein